MRYFPPSRSSCPVNSCGGRADAVDAVLSHLDSIRTWEKLAHDTRLVRSVSRNYAE